MDDLTNDKILYVPINIFRKLNYVRLQYPRWLDKKKSRVCLWAVTRKERAPDEATFSTKGKGKTERRTKRREKNFILKKFAKIIKYWINRSSPEFFINFFLFVFNKILIFNFFKVIKIHLEFDVLGIVFLFQH